MSWIEDNSLDCYDPLDCDYDEEEMEEDEWKTRDGKVMKITSMTDSHLENAYRVTGDYRLLCEINRRKQNK